MTMVDATDTRTPRRCSASTSERKSPSPENRMISSTCAAISMASTASSMSISDLTLRRPLSVDILLARLGDCRIAVVVEPIDQRTDRGIFLILEDRGVVEGAQQIAASLQLLQQLLVVDIEAQRFRGCVEIGAVDEHGKFRVCRHEYLQSVRIKDCDRPAMPDARSDAAKRIGDARSQILLFRANQLISGAKARFVAANGSQTGRFPEVVSP